MECMICTRFLILSHASDLACPLKPGYLKAVVDGGYRAEASTVDFRGDPEGSRQLINAWAARATNSLIDSVLGRNSVNELTRVVLGNAVYFKDKWDQPFVTPPTRRSAGPAAPAPSTCPSCRAGRGSSWLCTTGSRCSSSSTRWGNWVRARARVSSQRR
uniref:Serpin domain-containing protein n=1 Tax=Aegilops tauschii TaxID=37682 RepID=M8BD02_AEGTA